MKTQLLRNFLLLSLAALVFASCNIRILDSFSKQKYTNYKLVKHDAAPKTDAITDKTISTRNNPGATQALISPEVVTTAATTESPVMPHEPTIISQKQNKHKSTAAHTSIKPKRMFNSGTYANTAGSQCGQSTLLVILLCLFPFFCLIPVNWCHGIGTYFWIDLILCFTLIGGVIFAFIACFAL